VSCGSARWASSHAGAELLKPALSYRDKGYQCARDLLEINRDKVIKLAERLVERGHVGADEFLRLMDA
jgi:hypothetical protein